MNTVGSIKKCDRCKKFTRHQATITGPSCQECWNRIERGQQIQAERMNRPVPVNRYKAAFAEALEAGMTPREASQYAHLVAPSF